MQPDLKNTFPLPLPSSQAQLDADSLPPPPQWWGNRERGVAVSPSHVFSAIPSSSGKNCSQPSPTGPWHPSHERQCFMWISSVMNCSSAGFPQSHPSLVSVPCSSAGSSAGCSQDSLHHWPLKAGRAQPADSPWADWEWLLPCAFSSPSSLTSVSAWLFFSCLTPLPNKRTLKTKELVQQGFPLLIYYGKGTDWPSLGR